MAETRSTAAANAVLSIDRSIITLRNNTCNQGNEPSISFDVNVDKAK